MSQYWTFTPVKRRTSAKRDEWAKGLSTWVCRWAPYRVKPADLTSAHAEVLADFMRQLKESAPVGDA